jgi:uncharacterized membrane protein YdjX (TVP38/TMEM64 family)
VYHYLILFLIVLGVNLLPAFAPPTWSIIVIYGLNSNLPTPGIVLIGALAAALGRFLLAQGFRRLGRWLPEGQKQNLASARTAIEAKQRNVLVGLGLFALSPLPSAQLFEAAGLAGVRLVGFTIAFFIGRTVSYAIYATTAKGIRASSIGDVFADVLSSGWGISIQIGMLALPIGLALINWEGLLGKWRKGQD